MKQPITRKPDARFSMHGRQPRAHKLTRRDCDIARQDHAYAEALRQRTDPARVEALISKRGTYQSARPCPRCGGSRRRVHDAYCFDCWITRHRPPGQWEAVRDKQPVPGITRSRAGYLSLCEEQRRRSAGEFDSITVGHITAHAHPGGRLEIVEPAGIRCPDLRAIPYQTLFQLAHLHPSLVEVMRIAGWSVD